MIQRSLPKIALCRHTFLSMVSRRYRIPQSVFGAFLNENEQVKTCQEEKIVKEKEDQQLEEMTGNFHLFIGEQFTT